MSQRQENAIEYLREENRVLRSQLGNRRVRFTDDQRRGLAAKGSLLGRHDCRRHPVLETELNERDAFRAIFSFQQTLDGLNPAEVPISTSKTKRVGIFARSCRAPQSTGGGRRER